MTEVHAFTAEFGGGKHTHVAFEGNIHAGARCTAEVDAAPAKINEKKLKSRIKKIKSRIKNLLKFNLKFNFKMTQ